MEYNEMYYKEKAKLYKTIRIILICLALSPIVIILIMLLEMLLNMQSQNITLPF